MGPTIQPVIITMVWSSHALSIFVPAVRLNLRFVSKERPRGRQQCYTDNSQRTRGPSDTETVERLHGARSLSQLCFSWHKDDYENTYLHKEQWKCCRESVPRYAVST